LPHTYDHGGNIFEIARQLGAEPSELIDFSASINPLGLSLMVKKSIICAWTAWSITRTTPTAS